MPKATIIRVLRRIKRKIVRRKRQSNKKGGAGLEKFRKRRRKRESNTKTGAGLEKIRQCLQEINRQQDECKQYLNGCDLARV